MARNRIVRFVLIIAGVAAVVSQIGCSFEGIPANRERQKQAAREEYEHNSHEEIAASDRRKAEEMQRRKADPGSLSIHDSDAEIEALKSTSSIRRASAAEKLGDAKGPRVVAGSGTRPSRLASKAAETFPRHPPFGLERFTPSSLFGDRIPFHIQQHHFSHVQFAHPTLDL